MAPKEKKCAMHDAKLTRHSCMPKHVGYCVSVVFIFQYT